MILNGFKVIIEDTPIMKIEDKARTWKERLFSIPWKPWMKTKPVEVFDSFVVPDGQCIRVYDNLVMNSNTWGMIGPYLKMKDNRTNGVINWGMKA